ncbi:MAG: HupE/UreJ family protein [Gammaproteobacteria bacterium]|nr:HupE/UreJ family protein [Gammaproteobacteria bacterium]MDX2486459.1 HupE/UreJ family protein [Gammaproteobacteria bacterium]
MMKILAITLLSVIAPLAEAHTGIAQHGLASGLAHPFLGLDHLLAMVAVGIWAGSLGGKASWRIPLAFIAIMSVSALLSQGLMSMPLIESGIAVSLLLLGLFIVLAVKLPVVMGMLVVSLFAIFHGVAHGVEWPVAASPFWYVSGFVIATSLLHAVGVMAGASRNDLSQLFVRLTGALIATTGGFMLLAS